MKLSLLNDCQGCLIFLEANINVPETIVINNSVVFCENPVKDIQKLLLNFISRFWTIIRNAYIKMLMVYTT